MSPSQNNKKKEKKKMHIPQITYSKALHDLNIRFQVNINTLFSICLLEDGYFMYVHLKKDVLIQKALVNK